MHIILGTSANYLPFSAAAAASVCHHTRVKGRVVFHIMHAGDVGDAEADAFRTNLARFADRATFEFVAVRDSLGLSGQFRTTDHIKGSATYLRLYIPETFGGKFSRALYLDSDLVACRPLDELFEFDMGDHCLAGVEDANSLMHLGNLWLPPFGKYVNAGVLLWNLDAIDAKKIRIGLKKAATSPVKFQIAAGDQDLLSLLFQDGLTYLPSRWNVMVLNQLDGRPVFFERAGRLNAAAKRELRDSYANPCVLHYVGPNKPWSNNRFHDSLARRWFEYARMTGYFDDALGRRESRMRRFAPFNRLAGALTNAPLSWVLRTFYYELPRSAANCAPRGKCFIPSPAKVARRLDDIAALGAGKSRDFSMPENLRSAGSGVFFLASNPAPYEPVGFLSLAPSLLESRDLVPLRENHAAAAPGAVVCDAFDLDGIARRSAQIRDRVADGSPLLFLEAGPVSSVLDRCMSRRIPPRYKRYHSFRMDDRAFSFDTRAQSGFREFLDSAGSDISDADRRRCRRLIDRMVSERLSITNYSSPDSSPIRSGRAKGILVVDQSRNDPALRRSHADTDDFRVMLDDALRENPNREVYVYLGEAGASGHLSGTPRRENLRPISERANVYALLESIETVYVCNSHLGFEALLAGRKVVAYADSFYSGWGATEDRNRAAIRVRRHDIEELFHAVMFRNVVCFSPFSPRRVEPEQFLEEMAKLRDEFFVWAEKWT